MFTTWQKHLCGRYGSRTVRWRLRDCAWNHTLHGLPRQFWCPASLPTCQSTNTFPLLLLLNKFSFSLHFVLLFLLEVCMFCTLFCFRLTHHRPDRCSAEPNRIIASFDRLCICTLRSNISPSAFLRCKFYKGTFDYDFSHARQWCNSRYNVTFGT